MERVKAKLSKISSIKTRSLLRVLSDHDTGIVEHAATSTVNILIISKQPTQKTFCRKKKPFLKRYTRLTAQIQISQVLTASLKLITYYHTKWLRPVGGAVSIEECANAYKT